MKPLISVVMPCLNEEKTVGLCVKRARQGLKKLEKKGYLGEVIVGDNGSTDLSAKEAKNAGAKVVFELKKGYGSAYLRGIMEAQGKFVIIGDSDGTYDFRQILRFLPPLEAGYDLVIGSRLKGKIKKGAMPFLNRFLGTPILNLFLRLFYNLKLSDSQSGMRAFTKKAFFKMKLKSLGMEFASEMLIAAARENLKMAEVPISYSKRKSSSKLSRFRDAWRHLRFMLLFAPTYLFLLPGAILTGLGLLGVLALSQGVIFLFGRGLDVHSMILSSMLTLLGYQIVMLGIYAKVYSWRAGFEKGSWTVLTTLKFFNLERGIALGGLIALLGFLIGAITFFSWAKQGFGPLWAIRPAILSMTLFVLGIQIIFSSFFLSILGIEKR